MVIEAHGGDGAHSGAAQRGLRAFLSPMALKLLLPKLQDSCCGDGRVEGWREEKTAEEWRWMGEVQC